MPFHTPHSVGSCSHDSYTHSVYFKAFWMSVSKCSGTTMPTLKSCSWAQQETLTSALSKGIQEANTKGLPSFLPSAVGTKGILRKCQCCRHALYQAGKDTYISHHFSFHVSFPECGPQTRIAPLPSFRWPVVCLYEHS